MKQILKAEVDSFEKELCESLEILQPNVTSKDLSGFASGKDPNKAMNSNSIKTKQQITIFK